MATPPNGTPVYFYTSAGVADNALTLTPLLTNFGRTILSFPLAQGAAGTTVIAAASASNKHKILGVVLTMSAAGTIKFIDGSGDLTGAMPVSLESGFVIPMSLIAMIETTVVNSALSIVTTVGLAKGIVRYITEP